VGDVHGCIEELLELLAALGYRMERGAVTPPEGRKLAFAGDLVNRGPNTVEVLRLAMQMTQAGVAGCVAGNHEMKLLTALQGGTGELKPDVARSVAELAAEGKEFRAAAVEFLRTLPNHLVFDEGRLALAHKGHKEPIEGLQLAETRAIAVHGESSGARDESGLPVRVNWAAAYRGQALVVYGHTPVIEPVWLNNTVNIDTGCVYGGHLTALRYPERETVKVLARAQYYPSRKKFPPNTGLMKA
jgi:protein phosphatase